jgi:hypothetical protein
LDSVTLQNFFYNEYSKLVTKRYGYGSSDLHRWSARIFVPNVEVLLDLPVFGELARLSKNWVVISLPTRQLRWRRILKGRSPVIPDLPPVTIEEHWKPHHWELGRKSYPIKKIIQDFSDQGAQFVHQFQNTDHRYHTFLIFKTQLTKG